MMRLGGEISILWKILAIPLDRVCCSYIFILLAELQDVFIYYLFYHFHYNSLTLSLRQSTPPPCVGGLTHDLPCQYVLMK